MHQRAAAGGERPRWRVVGQSLGVHPDHGVHTLFAQPLQDQKRHALDAAFAIDLRPTASVPSHHPDSIEAPEVVQGPTDKFSPIERPRLIEIRENLADRIAEAEREGWLGEVESLSTSLAAAEEKIAQLDTQQERRDSTPRSSWESLRSTKSSPAQAT
ncbi:hypothetical protein ACIPD2_39775 [Streptomyces griseofuscus]|uniref:hypothetical protein n=1 Tax=Streptomyces griseofuscus TaxID=146922 RepID=UPI00382BD5F6